MLGEDLGRGGIREGIGEPHAPRHLADDPPVRLRLAGSRQEGALARDAPLGIRDRAVLLAPAAGRQQHMRAARDAVGRDARSRRRPGDRACCSAARAVSASGRDTAGLVAMIQRALMRPSAILRNSATALSPSRSAMRGAFQKRRTRSTSGAEKPIWAASMLARPPTSRPPIAFGCPVSENGPRPGRPMRPVARWQLMMAPTLSVPCADWLTPWL